MTATYKYCQTIIIYLLEHIGYLLSHWVMQEIDISMHGFSCVHCIQLSGAVLDGFIIGLTVPLTKPKQLSDGEPYAEIASAYFCK